jgi:hypothetical protein
MVLKSRGFLGPSLFYTKGLGEGVCLRSTGETPVLPAPSPKFISPPLMFFAGGGFELTAHFHIHEHPFPGLVDA